jgi:hypothetical protein
VEKVLVNQKQSQKQSENVFQRTEQQTRENGFSLTVKQDHSWFKSQAGFDLTQIPVHPALHTNPQIQCCAKDGSNCSCPKCRAEAESAKENENGEPDEQQETAEAQPEQNISEPPVAEQDPEEVPGVPRSEEIQENETENKQEELSSTLIVEDDVTDLSEGQIRKTEFLQKLRSSICDTIGPVLATVGQTTEGCPYLNYWLDLYQEKDAAHIERTAKKYAPDVANAKTAEEYISIIAQRALRAAEIWVRTGKLNGVPEGVPTALPNETTKENNKEENPVQAKAKHGGVKKADDPTAIKNKLGDGQPLSSDLRLRMESAFGINFSHVRTHTDSTATHLSNQVNARAFTVGNHIAFGNGEYQPGTLLGDTLIAHELAHTIQQNGAENSVDKLESGTAEYNSLERDADSTAIGIVHSLWGDKKNERVGMIQRLIPTLRSGLKIQRCPASHTSAKTTTPTQTQPQPQGQTTATPTTTNPSPTSGTPCPTGVRIGAVAPRNHSSLSIGDKDKYLTYIGAVAKMDLDPGPDHTGHCMKEKVTLKSNTCPADFYTKGDKEIEPCSGNKCLDVNNGSQWGLSTDAKSFLDFHRTISTNASLLEGTGVNACKVECEQTYSCDRRYPTTGKFLITRNFQAGTYTKSNGTTVHITTGSVTKT